MARKSTMARKPTMARRKPRAPRSPAASTRFAPTEDIAAVALARLDGHANGLSG
jgi:hypothetical protein